MQEYDYDIDGYKGFLDRGEATELYSTPAHVVAVDEVTGQITYESSSTWEVTFSGTLTKEFTTGTKEYLQSAIDSEDVPVYYDSTALQTHNEECYDIGAGWSFNIPTIDYAGEESEDSDRLILPGVGSFAFYNNKFSDYDREDMTLTDDDSYTAGQFSSDKKLTLADGTVYYFSEDGLLLAMLDRFGNTIRYRYAQVDGDYHPCEIIDTAGRSTTIVYADTADGRTVTRWQRDGTAHPKHRKYRSSGRRRRRSHTGEHRIPRRRNDHVHLQYGSRQLQLCRRVCEPARLCTTQYRHL